MPPPPNTARALRARPISLTLLTAQVQRDVEHNVAAKVQNARIEAVFNEIGDLTEKAKRLDTRIATFNQLALDAIAADDPSTARSHILTARALGDELRELHEKITAKKAEGLVIEAEDVKRETQRGHEAGIRRAQIDAARRGQPDGWRPDGPGIA